MVMSIRRRPSVIVSKHAMNLVTNQSSTSLENKDRKMVFNAGVLEHSN